MVRVAFALLFLGWAATGASAQPAPNITETAIGEEAESVSAQGNVSLDFRDADIRNVLKILAFKSGVNIVAGPEVTGTVTIQLKDVPWERALDVILSTYGYGFQRKGNIVLVTTVENLKKRREEAQLMAEQEPLITKPFPLNFGKASEVVESIEKMLTARGSVNFDQRTNVIIVRDIESNMNLMEEVIIRLDSITPQVMIEAKIVETTLSDTENLGVDWTLQVSVDGAARPHTWPFTDISHNKFFNRNNFPHISDTLSAAKDDFTYGTINANQLQVVLEMLQTRSNTNILSNPKIVTLDNQPARIVVGSQYPIPSYTYNEEQARLQVSGWEYKDIGIIFEVTPHVNNKGMVTLDLEPNITDILDFVTVENTQLPRLSTESAKTSVMIADGQTLVIGGLIKDQTTDTDKKVPFLGDIPILGKLFTKTTSSTTKTDLLIFLTPHIITPEASSN